MYNIEYIIFIVNSVEYIVNRNQQIITFCSIYVYKESEGFAKRYNIKVIHTDIHINSLLNLLWAFIKKICNHLKLNLVIKLDVSIN